MKRGLAGRLRHSALNLLLALASTALVLGAAEWALRRYLPVAGFLYRPDPRYHYTLQPKARRLFRHAPHNGGHTILVTVNSDGFRGEELRRGGGPRVVVYGDSCVEADYSRLPETFTQRLGARLRERTGLAVEAVNAGVNGYGPDQAARRFADEVRWLRPRAVVFAVFSDNDFGDLERNRLYALEGGRLVEAGGVLAGAARETFGPVGQAGTSELWSRIRHAVRRGRRRHRLTPAQREARLAGAIASHIPNSLLLCRQEYDQRVRRRDLVISDLVKDHYDADLALDPQSEEAAYKRALLEAVLRRVRSTAEAAGVPVLVLVVPSPIDVCEGNEIAVDATRYPEYDRRRLSSEAAAAAGRAGLPVIDLFDPFRAVGAAGLYYHRGEDHWNAAGQDLAARLASEKIAAERWLDGA